VPHYDSPHARIAFWRIDLYAVDLAERVEALYEAVNLAGNYAGQAIYDATGQELRSIVSGIIPGLLFCLAVVATTTAIGGVAGAALGALAGGVGAVPGAAAGADTGFAVGLGILDYLGLGFLVAYVAVGLAQAVSTAGDGMLIAWRSVDQPGTQRLNIDLAAHKLAFALGILFRSILQGIVAFLLAKGVAAAAGRVPELAAKLRASRLGAGFADWVGKNWKSLVDDPRLNPKPQGAGGARSGAGEEVGESAGSGSSKNEPPALPAKTAMQQAIDKAIQSPNKGTNLEGTVAQGVQDAGFKVTKFQQKFGPNGSTGEIDVETPQAIIETTVSRAGKLEQIMERMNNTDMNPTSKPVILYAPNYGGAASRDITGAGAYVVKNMSDLTTLLGQLGGR
jgi:hypothetical protein